MYTTIYKGRRITIDYQNDIIFKKMLGDLDSQEFLKQFVYIFTGRKFDHLTVTNSENLGKYVFEKANRLDIKAISDEGVTVNVEMQKGYFTDEQEMRFQIYGFENTVLQLRIGDRYGEVKEVYEIIITPDRVGKWLVTDYKLRDKEGDAFSKNLLTIYIVSLAQVKMNKDGMDDQNILCYAFKNGVDDAIMKIADKKQKGMLGYMKSKYESIVADPWLIDEAKEAALAKELREAELRDSRKQGIEQGTETTAILNITTLMETLNSDIDHVMDLLKIEDSKREYYKKLIIK